MLQQYNGGTRYPLNLNTEDHEEYALNYVQWALHNDTPLPDIDPQRANGTTEILVCIKNAHDKGGVQSAQKIWAFIQEQRPAFAQRFQTRFAEGQALPLTQRWFLLAAAHLDRLPKVEWIIPNEIPAQSLIMLYGTSGVGKSFMALDYALRIAQEAPVVYMAGEGMYGYRQRLAAWKQHHQKDEGRLTFCLGAVRLLEEEDLSAFIGTIVALQPRLVVIDTLARAMTGGDENSTRDMMRLVDACDRIRREVGCSVLVVHHTNKIGIVERGNNALRGACDQIIKLSGDDDLITWEVNKSKDGEVLPPRYLKRVKVRVETEGENKETLESCVLVEAEQVVQTLADPLTRNQQKVLDALGMKIFEAGAEVSDLVEMSELGRGSVQRVLSKLLELGLVAQAGKRQPYLLTELGETRLTRQTQADTSPKTTKNSESTESCESSASLNTQNPPENAVSTATQSESKGESSESSTLTSPLIDSMRPIVVPQPHESNESSESSLKTSLTSIPSAPLTRRDQSVPYGDFPASHALPTDDQPAQNGEEGS